MNSVREVISKVVKENSGHTFTPLPGRYIVSLPGEQVFTTDNLDKAESAVQKAMATTGENTSVGLWMDDGKLYVDVSESYDRLDVAMRVAKERDQLAIYDQMADKALTVAN